MRSYITPIGYDSRRVTRPVLSHGLDTGDHIILLQPSSANDDARAEEAIKDIDRLITQIEPEVDIIQHKIPYQNTVSCTLQCVDILEDAEGETVVNFGGGARDILVPFVVAVLSNIDYVDKALQFSDIDGEVRQYPTPKLTTGVPEKAWQTLNAISRATGAISISELERELNLSKSTITRHIKDLENKAVVETTLDGKQKKVELTFTGELLIRTRKNP